MAENTETYRHMPTTVLGTLLRWFDRSSTWLASDHILLTRQTLWIEQYNRFYFADIQAVAICQTQTGRVGNILFGTGAGLLALAGMINGPSVPILVWLVLFSVPLIVNTLMGPTCSCCVYTAVNTHKLPCLNRMAKANLFLQIVRPLITEVQGEVSDEEIVERAPLIPPVRAAAPRKIHHYNGQVHMSLFILLLLGTIACGVQLAAQSVFVGWLITIVLIAQFGMAIAAAVRQSDTDIPPGLRTVVWLAFGHTLVMPVLFIIAAVATFEYRLSPMENSEADGAFFIVNILSASFSAILCFVGRHLLSTFRDTYRFNRMAARTQVRTLDEQEI